MSWDDHYTGLEWRRMQAKKAAAAKAAAAKPAQAAKPPSRAQIEARLRASEAQVAEAFRMLGLSGAGVEEVRDRIAAGESIDSLMSDFSTYRAGSTLSREQLAYRMKCVTLDPRATRSTSAKLQLGPTPPGVHSRSHDRAALAARMGVALEGSAEPRGTTYSGTCKLTLSPPLKPN